MRKLLLTFVLALTLCMPSLAAETWTVGPWKTAQTIQPFLYEPFANGATVKVHPFTNPGDQKAALLEMCIRDSLQSVPVPVCVLLPFLRYMKRNPNQIYL